MASVNRAAWFGKRSPGTYSRGQKLRQRPDILSGFLCRIGTARGVPGMMSRARQPAQRDKDLLATGGATWQGKGWVTGTLVLYRVAGGEAKHSVHVGARDG